MRLQAARVLALVLAPAIAVVAACSAESAGPSEAPWAPGTAAGDPAGFTASPKDAASGGTDPVPPGTPRIPESELATILGPWQAVPPPVHPDVAAAAHAVCNLSMDVPPELRTPTVVDARGEGLLVVAQRGPAEGISCLLAATQEGTLSLAAGGMWSQQSFAVGEREIDTIAHSFYELAADRVNFSDLVLLAGPAVVRVEGEIGGRPVTFTSAGGWHAAWGPGHFGGRLRGFGADGSVVVETEP